MNHIIPSSLSSLSLNVLNEISFVAEYFVLQDIYSHFNPKNYIEKPGEITKEAAKLCITLIKRMNSSDLSEIFENENTILLLLDALLFEDKELREKIIQTLFFFDKEKVISQINEETKETIEEAISEINIPLALELLE